jgi:crotonobetaine/carnitine-CoA ligase
LRRAAEFGRERSAIVFGDRVVSYGQLDDDANRIALALRGLGVKQGDRVAVLMANSPEYIAFYHGVARAGAIFVPLVTQSKLPELEYFVGHSEPVVLVVDEPRWEVVSSALMPTRSPAFATIRHIVCLGPDAVAGAIGFDALIDGVPPEPPVRLPQPGEPVAFMYTSGSTGRPKAVIHSHFTAVAQAEAVSERMGYTEDDRLMTIFPLFHGNALVWSALAAVYARCPVIIHERFSASRFWQQTRQHNATEVNLLLGAINMILAQPELPDDADNPVRLVLGNVTESVNERFTRRFGVDIVSTWALAEGPLGTMTAPGFGYRAGLIGWPMGHDNEVKVFGDEDRELPPGEVGELVQRNAAAMLGYHRNEAETARVLRGGWVRSGDLGYRGEDGLFYFVGRQKHVIRRAGENVSGEEVEDCLNAHPSVAEAAVIAVPDDIRGEEVKAYVVIRQGKDLSAAELIQWCSERLADFKIPRYLEFRSELPRTGPHRVDRPALSREPGLTDCWDRLNVQSLSDARS